MNNVNKTLYIPLYGKAYVSKKGIILSDKKAEQIWEEEGFPLKGKSKSKWLAYYMGMRSTVFDEWLKEKIENFQDSVVLHLGCGMDSRVERVNASNREWYDVDFPEVIKERKRYYQETENYHMLQSDVRDMKWLQSIPKEKTAIVVMEGISMYLSNEELKAVLKEINSHFEQVHLFVDCYTTFAAKASKYKNPINDVGVTKVYGLDDPEILTENAGLMFVKEHEMTPQHLVEKLEGLERKIFQKVYGGSISKKMYRLYEYKK